MRSAASRTAAQVSRLLSGIERIAGHVRTAVQGAYPGYDEIIWRVISGPAIFRQIDNGSGAI